MNIVIAGGQTKADFLISMFKKEKHNLIVINDNYEYADYLSKKHGIDVIVGDATSTVILSESNINNFDIIVAITPSDTDNLMICQLGKKLFNIHKTVASVSDPKNVEHFTRLGVDTAISATFLISKYIEKASILENMTRTIVTEFDSLSITTMTIQDDFYVNHRSLSEIKLPEGVSIGAILRGNEVMVPNGKSVIESGDKILIITSSDMQKTAINIIKSKTRD